MQKTTNHDVPAGLPDSAIGYRYCSHEDCFAEIMGAAGDLCDDCKAEDAGHDADRCSACDNDSDIDLTSCAVCRELKPLAGGCICDECAAEGEAS